MACFNFTAKSIDGLKPQSKRLDHFDTSFRVKGINFGVRISASGSKEYFVRYRDNYGKQRRMSIGDAKIKSLAAAREKAKEIASALDDGKNPAIQLKQYKLAESVEEFCNIYFEHHAKFKKNGGSEDRRMLHKDVIPYIGKMKVCDVRRRDVIGLIEKVAIERGAKVSANRLRSLLSKLFNFALERELIETTPCAGLPKKSKEKTRERVLSEQEIKDLWQWLENEAPVNAAIFRLILLTAQRPMEVASMEWSELHGEFWNLPGQKTKNGRSQKIPLSPLAYKSIESMMLIRKGDFIFQGQKGEHVMARTLQHVCERANRTLKGQRFTPHDLRRTAATYLRKLGVSREVVARLLNHSNGGVTAVYDRHDLIPEIRDGLYLWSKELITIVGMSMPEVKVRVFGGR